MKDKIDEITYNLELGCIDWQEASKQLFDLYGVMHREFKTKNIMIEKIKKEIDKKLFAFKEVNSNELIKVISLEDISKIL